jgi:hypothetical protein
VADAAPLRCAACRHEIADEDVVRTVGGRRFHAACVDAHRAGEGASRDSVTVLARFTDRVSGLPHR